MDTTNWNYQLGDYVKKAKGAEWAGVIVGFYSTALTPRGYAIESDFYRGTVQIYPEAALEPINK